MRHDPRDLLIAALVTRLGGDVVVTEAETIEMESMQTAYTMDQTEGAESIAIKVMDGNGHVVDRSEGAGGAGADVKGKVTVKSGIILLH